MFRLLISLPCFSLPPSHQDQGTQANPAILMKALEVPLTKDPALQPYVDRLLNQCEKC